MDKFVFTFRQFGSPCEVRENDCVNAFISIFQIFQLFLWLRIVPMQHATISTIQFQRL